jgi:hypothetical protein
MKTQSLGLALVFALVATVLGCQDGGVVAPDGIQPQFAKPDFCDAHPDHPKCGGGGEDPGEGSGTVLVLREGVVSDETYDGTGEPSLPPDGNIQVDNNRRFLGQASINPRTHGLTPNLEVNTCTFDLPPDFRDPLLVAGSEQRLEDHYLNPHRIAGVVVRWDLGQDASIKFWGNIPIPDEDPPDTMIPEIYLLAGPEADRDQLADHTKVYFTIETIRVVFGTKMGGGSVTCSDLSAQEVTATFYPL